MIVHEEESMQVIVCQRRILHLLNTHQAIAECHRVVGG